MHQEMQEFEIFNVLALITLYLKLNRKSLPK